MSVPPSPAISGLAVRSKPAPEACQAPSTSRCTSARTSMTWSRVWWSCDGHRRIMEDNGGYTSNWWFQSFSIPLKKYCIVRLDHHPNYENKKCSKPATRHGCSICFHWIKFCGTQNWSRKLAGFFYQQIRRCPTFFPYFSLQSVLQENNMEAQCENLIQSWLFWRVR